MYSTVNLYRKIITLSKECIHVKVFERSNTFLFFSCFCFSDYLFVCLFVCLFVFVLDTSGLVGRLVICLKLSCILIKKESKAN